MEKLEYLDVDRKWQELIEKLENEGYKSFTLDERLWFNVGGIIGAINSGGIGSYYINKWFEDMDDTFEDLKKLEAENVIEMLMKVNGFLPEGTLHKDADEISDIFADLGDQSEDFVELLDDLNEIFANDIEEELEVKLEQIIKRLIF